LWSKDIWHMGIDIKVVIELFVAGIGLGFGPCFLFCAPIISSYIFAHGFNHKEGFKITITFSLGRIVAYSILGLVTVVFLNTLGIQKYIFKQIAGILILLILPIYNFWEGDIKFCNILNKFFVNKTKMNTFLLGLLIGLSPCAPLVGILTYIACKSEYVFLGIFYGFIFGIGTFFSPLIFSGFLAGLFSGYLSKMHGIFLFFKILGNIFLIYFGIKLIL
jgi:sulfite exporter TauE/SafE